MSEVKLGEPFQAKDGNYWEIKQKGDKVIGVYTSLKENVGSHKSNVYHLKQKDDTEILVWGSTALDGIMKEVPTGTLIQIEYMGSTPIPGKNDLKLFEVRPVITE